MIDTAQQPTKKIGSQVMMRTRRECGLPAAPGSAGRRSASASQLQTHHNTLTTNPIRDTAARCGLVSAVPRRHKKAVGHQKDFGDLDQVRIRRIAHVLHSSLGHQTTRCSQPFRGTVPNRAFSSPMLLPGRSTHTRCSKTCLFSKAAKSRGSNVEIVQAITRRLLVANRHQFFWER